MIRLALETATSWLGVAVVEGGVVRAEFHRRLPLSQSAALLPAVRETLREAGLALGAVEGLAVSQGPGSFTGLRVGAATGRALADALGAPLAAVPTLLALALGAELKEGHGQALLAGPREECFRQAFEVARGLPRPRGELEVTTYERLAAAPPGMPGVDGLWVCDPLAAERLAALGAAEPPVRRIVAVEPRARWVGEYAERAGLRGGPAREFTPLYGKSPIYRKRPRVA